MSRHYFRVVTTLAAVCLSVCLQAAEFKDPLDAPALITPRATSSLMLSVTAAGSRLVAVGEYGRIIVSDSAGKDWRQVDSPVSVDLVSVWFASETTGWATGHAGAILKSTDGGLSWKKLIDGRDVEHLMRDYYQRRLNAGDQAAADFIRDINLNFQNGPELPFLDVWFRNEREGFVVGAFGMILATQDGGDSWTPWLDRIDNPEVLHLNAVHSAGGEVFIVGERGTVWKLDSQAQHFAAYQTGYAGSLFGVTGDDHSCVVFGLRGTAYRSTDGCQTWMPLQLLAESSIFSGIVLPGGTLVLATQSGLLMTGAVDGAEFETLRVEGRGGVAGIALAEPGVVVVAGSGGVRRVTLPQQLQSSIHANEEKR